MPRLARPEILLWIARTLRSALDLPTRSTSTRLIWRKDVSRVGIKALADLLVPGNTAITATDSPGKSRKDNRPLRHSTESITPYRTPIDTPGTNTYANRAALIILFGAASPGRI